MPEPMSQEAADRIVTVLSKAAQLVGEGDSPSVAIEKAAREADVPAGHIPLMVSAYNVGRSTRQREDGEGPLDKAADFELADTAAILERLFPSDLQKAAAVAAPRSVDSVYLTSPASFLETRRRRRKVASAPPVMKLVEQPPPPLPRSNERALLKAAADERRLKDAADEARRQATALEYELRARFAKLADDFRTPGHLTVAEVRSNVQAMYGDDGTAVLDHVVKLRPSLTKAASLSRRHRADQEPVYAAIGTVLEKSEALVRAREARAVFEKLASPVARKPAAPKDVLDRLEKKAGPAIGDKAIGGLTYNVVSDLYSGWKPPDPADAVRSQMGRLMTPEHEDNLREIQTQAMLHELLNDDEVLRGHDHHEVSRAFNRISQLVNDTSLQPAVIVPAVRKAMAQGGLDNFDAKELIDSHNKLHESKPAPYLAAPHPAKP